MGRVRAAHFVGVQGFVGASSSQGKNQNDTQENYADDNQNRNNEPCIPTANRGFDGARSGLSRL